MATSYRETEMVITIKLMRKSLLLKYLLHTLYMKINNAKGLQGISNDVVEGLFV